MIRLETGRVALVRPLRPDDERLYPDFDARLSDEDRRFRFFSAAHLSERQIWAFTHFDRAEASAFAALDPADGAMLGVARLHRLEVDAGEFAVLVRSDLKGQGLGRELMTRVLRSAAPLGIRRIVGFVLRENACMLAFARDLGFALRADPDDAAVMRAELDLGDHGRALGEGPAEAALAS